MARAKKEVVKLDSAKSVRELLTQAFLDFKAGKISGQDLKSIGYIGQNLLTAIKAEKAEVSEDDPSDSINVLCQLIQRERGKIT
jgi:hypothetical protein